MTIILIGFAVFIAAVFFILICGLFISRLYKRASKEISFVRTGWRGQKVIVNGGALVFPVLHETIPVNMNTLRLEVQRNQAEALITRDRMRVDVRAEFYVRVKPTEEAIADAAQTLGRRTMDSRALKELVEGKFVDALRAVAAEMAMEELHEKRVDFVQKVQTAVSEDLRKNGLELETVSLTSLDQTDQTFFNPANAFDASGLTRLTEEIQARRKQRNDIEQDTEVQIRMKNLEAERLKLQVARDEEYARLQQQREVEIRRAEQVMLIAQEQAAKDRQAREAQILAKQQVDTAGITADRTIAEQRIEMEQMIKERDITKMRAVELADQDRAIAIAAKSKDQSLAQAEADRARAIAVKAAEEVTTSKETEIAEREKAIQLVEARKIAEQDAIGLKVAAEAQKAAAVDKAEAIRTLATADADKITIAAKGDADAELLRAEASRVRYEVDAKGQRALHEADNILDPGIIAMRIKMAVIENIDKIIRESVKPIEAIDAIKIIQVQGLGNDQGSHLAYAGAGGSNGSTNSGGNSGGGSGGNLADQVVNSALRYRSQAPLVDALLKDIGLDGSTIHGLASVLPPITTPSQSTTPIPDTDAKA